MITVVIPSYRVKNHILDVIHNIGPSVQKIYVVDDCCPEQSGKHVQEQCKDPRVCVIFHEKNQGVGGAMISGYRRALEDGASIVVKLDGDGQMDPALIPAFIQPLLSGKADFTKGNRFYSFDSLAGMPAIRLFGNSVLSFGNKLINGYWNIMDPTNGFIAIRGEVLRQIPLHKLEKTYFFESDLLFRLNTVRAVVQDIPMRAHYADEKSSLAIGRVLFEFPKKYLHRFLKRIVYNYFLRDFNVGSIELIVGLLLTGFGVVFGLSHWIGASHTGTTATSGTVMLASLPIILGMQMLLSVVQFDILNVPQTPIHPFLKSENGTDEQQQNKLSGK